MTFKMDPNFERNLRRQVEKTAGPHYQQMFDRLSRQYRGKPIDQVKRAVKKAWEADGGKITEPDLTQWAEAIASGTRIKVRFK